MAEEFDFSHLSPEEFHVLREAGTERAWSGEYNKHYSKGNYTAGDAAISYLKVTRSLTPVQDGRALTRHLMEASLNWKTVPMECSGWKCNAHAVKAIWDMYFPMDLEKPPVSAIA